MLSLLPVRITYWPGLTMMGGRGPGCKSVRGDADAISSWFETFEFKESVVVRHHRAWISGDGTLKNDGGASNGVVVHVRYSAGNTCCPRLGCIDVLCRQRCGHRNRGQDQHANLEGSHNKSSQWTIVGSNLIPSCHFRSYD